MESTNLYKGELSILDYGVFLSVLAISVTIGIYNGFKGKKTDEDFFLAGRSFGFLPVGMSLLMSYLSAISLLGMTGEAYADGIQFFVFFIGSSFGILVASITTVPVFYNLQIVSVNEYLEMRFQSKLIRKIGLCIALIKSAIYMGVALYAPTIALTAVTPLDSTTYIFILGIICTIYSSFGGMRAVIWTDVFQCLIMTAGMTAVLVLAFSKVGGIQEFWSIARDGGRLSIFNMSLSLTDRYTFFNCLAFGFFFSNNSFSYAQEVIQRLRSVKSLTDAKRVLGLYAVGNLIANSSLLLCGVAMYVYYYGCDPITMGVIAKRDQILPLFIMQTTTFIYGFPGLFIGIVFAAALSTLSSILNSCVAMLWKDLLQEIQFFKNMPPEKAKFTNKILSIFMGAAMIGIAIVASNAGGLSQIIYSVNSALNGPLYGIFILGFFFPKCASRGALLGILVSWAFISWMSLGGYFCASSGRPQLPLSVEMCTNSSFIPENNLPPTEFIQPSTHCQMFNAFYNVSYTLYIIIGPFLCVFMGLLYSHLTAKSKDVVTTKDLVSPTIWRFYWKTETR